MSDIDARELAGRYVAVWTESDAELRRRAIRELWTDHGAHILQPPLEIRQATAGLGFTSAALYARGHEELEIRVTRAYQDFVAPGKFTFQARDDAYRLDNVVKFTWDMVPADGGVPAGGGQAAATGLEILVLAEDGRIQADYQFLET